MDAEARDVEREKAKRELGLDSAPPELAGGFRGGLRVDRRG
jgi:hypothetical protein